MTYEFHAENIKAFETLESLGVTLAKYPDDVIEAGKKALIAVVAEQSAASKDFAKVYGDIAAYMDQSRRWSDASLGYFLNIR